MRNGIVKCFVIVTSLLICFGCNREESINGRWATANSAITLDFFADHTGIRITDYEKIYRPQALLIMTVNGIPTTEKNKFKWTFLKDNVVKIEYDNDFIQMKLNENKLTDGTKEYIKQN